MVHWNFIKSLKKQAKQWKTDKKTGKQENVQKTRKNRKTGSTGTLEVKSKLYIIYYIILSRVNNINIKQKRYGYLFCRSGKIRANKTQQISVKTRVFFVKTELQHI